MEADPITDGRAGEEAEAESVTHLQPAVAERRTRCMLEKGTLWSYMAHSES